MKWVLILTVFYQHSVATTSFTMDSTGEACELNGKNYTKNIIEFNKNAKVNFMCVPN